MISFVSGKIQNLNQNSLTILIGGIGFEVFTLKRYLEKYKVGEEVKLHTHLHVREDNLSLFGFPNPAELKLFNTLLSVSGIGPKVALKVLEKASVSQLHLAIIGEDIAFLKAIPGIGGRTAERLVVELKSKLAKEKITAKPGVEEVQLALQGLGYEPTQINEVISKIPSSLKTVQERLKYVLKLLGE